MSKTLSFVLVLCLCVSWANLAQAGKRASSPAKKWRAPASVAEFAGGVAKDIYDGLPGAADEVESGVEGKEGDLVCYHKAENYRCSVRGEDEESGTFSGERAKLVFKKLPAASEYEDFEGMAREAAVRCTVPAGKSVGHHCQLVE